MVKATQNAILPSERMSETLKGLCVSAFQRAFAAALVLLTLSACSSSPAAPAAPATPTKVIAIVGSLSFGSVPVGRTSAAQSFTIKNVGNTAVTVTGISGPCDAFLAASFTSGLIPAGGSQLVSVTFTPTFPVVTCNGTITIASDATGTATVTVTGAGTLDGVPIFSMSGVGNSVFNIPSYITKLHIVGTYTGDSSNFIVVVGGLRIVDDVIGTLCETVSDGTYVVTGGQVNIAQSTGVSWTITEVR
jgi:hypothetical protein